MAYQDSEFRYRPNLEPPAPFSGDFSGRDILYKSQFDPDSLHRLSIVAQEMGSALDQGSVPPLLETSLIVSTYERRSPIALYVPTESAVLRLGGKGTIDQEFPDPRDMAAFDYSVLDIKSVSPDAILALHSNNQTILKMAEVLRNTQGAASPLINLRAVEDVFESHPLFERYKDANPVALRMALLALVLGKVH